MDTSRKENPWLSWRGLTVILMAVGGWMIYRSRLTSERPPQPESIEHTMFPERDVPARPWVDPFLPCLDHHRTLEVDGKRDATARRVSPSSPLRVKCPDSNEVLWILAMVKGEFSAEEIESRRRSRQAVHAALACEAFAPRDPERLWYVHHRLFDLAEEDSWTRLLRGLGLSGFWLQCPGFPCLSRLWPDPERGTVGQSGEECPNPRDATTGGDDACEDLLIPYEYFDHDPLVPECCFKHVVVLWLADRAFKTRPLGKLQHLIKSLDVGDKGRVRILGPASSGTLREMIQGEVGGGAGAEEEAGDFWDATTKKREPRIQILSPWSTVAEELLLLDFGDPGSCDDEGKQEAVTPADRASCQAPEEDPAANDDQGAGLPCHLLLKGHLRKTRQVHFQRTIGTDTFLAEQLLRELERRGVNPGEHNILLLVERDSYYGRAFAVTFEAQVHQWLHGQPPPLCTETGHAAFQGALNRVIDQANDPDQRPPKFHVYGYLRGVDGKAPGFKDSPVASTGSDAEGISGSETHLLYARGAGPELPVGRSQIDYVRRLANLLIERHADRGPGVKAIGIIGTDVYDKLLLIKALRSQFPHAVFFTTDMDARLQYSKEHPWTRNLVIASSFGLRLRKCYQSGTSDLGTFRDSYQTALFLAARMAVHSSFVDDLILREALARPRLYEIGRDRAHDITVRAWESEKSLHPPRPRLWQGWHSVQTLAAALVCLLAASFLARDLVPCIQRYFEPERQVDQEQQKEPKAECRTGRRRWYAAIACFLAVVLFAALVVYEGWIQPAGEPFCIAGGVSIWPTEFLRLVAAGLGIGLLIRAHRRLRKNTEQMEKSFALTPDNASGSSASDRKQPEDGVLRKLKILDSRIRAFWSAFRHRQPLMFKKDAGTGDKTDAPQEQRTRTSKRKESKAPSKSQHKTSKDPFPQALWKDYTEVGMPARRWGRILRQITVFVLVGVSLMLIFGFPSAPARGDLSRAIDKVVLLFSVAVTLLVVFFVVDATLLCRALIGNLLNGGRCWAEESVKRHLQSPQPKARVSPLSRWLDVQLVAERSAVVGNLIYYPFLVILVMVFARSEVFDDWDWPTGLVVVVSLCALYAVWCAVTLRWEAEKVRKQALGELDLELIRAQANVSVAKDSRSAVTQLIKDLKKSVMEERRGAFSSFSQNPVLGALLIPSGGITLLEVLRLL